MALCKAKPQPTKSAALESEAEWRSQSAVVKWAEAKHGLPLSEPVLRRLPSSQPAIRLQTTKNTMADTGLCMSKGGEQIDGGLQDLPMWQSERHPEVKGRWTRPRLTGLPRRAPHNRITCTSAPGTSHQLGPPQSLTHGSRGRGREGGGGLRAGGPSHHFEHRPALCPSPACT